MSYFEPNPIELEIHMKLNRAEKLQNSLQVNLNINTSLSLERFLTYVDDSINWSD
jgi:hypothetical protein